MILGLIFTVALIVGLVVLVVWGVRRMSGTSSQYGSPITPSQSARDIAQARYAKGEITRDEYQQILSDLSRGLQPLKPTNRCILRQIGCSGW